MAAPGRAIGVSQPPTLALGQRGPWVRTLQTALTAIGKTLSADGAFGPHTHEAVTGYQRDTGLVADGVVGPRTWGGLLGVSFAGGQGAAPATPAAAGPAAGPPAFGAAVAAPGTASRAGLVNDSPPAPGAAPPGAAAAPAGGGGAAPGGLSLADLGVVLSSAVESLLTLALRATGLDLAFVAAQVAHLLGGSPASSGHIALVLAKVGLEVASVGPYGPAWLAAAQEQILPPPPTWIEQQAARVEFFAQFARWPEAFGLLNGLQMLDIVDVLRVSSAATRTQLDTNFAAGTTGLDGPRLRAALDTVTNRAVPALPANLPGDQAAVLQGFATLRQWPAMLPLAGRDKPHRITTNGVNPPPGKSQIDVPDLGQRTDTLPPDQQAIAP